MRRGIVIAVGCLVSSSVFASVTISTAPQQPVVMTADRVIQGDSGPITIKAPWVSLQYEIRTDKMITIVGIQEVVKYEDGSVTSYFVNFQDPIEIEANKSFKTEIQYLSQLRRQSHFFYDVTARLIGWSGSSSSSGPMLDVQSRFLTH